MAFIKIIITNRKEKLIEENNLLLEIKELEKQQLMRIRK
jgi:hypothetical protein